MKCVFALTIALSLAAASGLAGEQSQAPPVPASKMGTVRGRVLSAATGKPLRRARVTMQPVLATPTPAGLTATSNSQGVFEVKDVPEGAYFVSAASAGHLSIEYGQRRPGERGLAVDVRAGRTVERIDIALPRGAVLGGRITDELGEPYPGVEVMALERRYRSGRQVPFPAGTATSDDRGRFRFPGLNPGSYYVSATSLEMWRNEKNDTLAYGTTYFPGVPADRAEAVTVGVAQERLDLDFTLTMGRASRVRGRVLRSTGEAAAGESVMLALTIRGQPGIMIPSRSHTTRTTADGAFDFRNVAPADYLLRVGGGAESGGMTVTVNGDVENLLLTTRRGSTVNGTIVTDEGGAPPFPASGVRLLLVSADDERVLPTVRFPAINSDWSFRLTSVGGPFLFRVSGIPEDWMLDAVRLEDRNITDVPWDVPTGGREIGGLQMVLTKTMSAIAGTVLGANGKPTTDATVVLFPDDEALWIPGSRHVRTLRPRADGAFTLTSLPPATYLLAARDFVVNGQWEDREFLDSLRRDAVRVVLTAGSSESVTLRVQ